MPQPVTSPTPEANAPLPNPSPVADFPADLERRLRDFLAGEGVELPRDLDALGLFRRNPEVDVVPEAVAEKLLTSSDAEVKQLRDDLADYYGERLTQDVLGADPPPAPPPERPPEALQSGTASTSTASLGAEPLVSSSALGGRLTAGLETSERVTDVGEEGTTRVTESGSASARIEAGVDPSAGFGPFVEARGEIEADVQAQAWNERVTDPATPPALSTEAALTADTRFRTDVSGTALEAGVQGEAGVTVQPEPGTTLDGRLSGSARYHNTPEGERTTTTGKVEAGITQEIAEHTEASVRASRNYTATNNAGAPDTYATTDEVEVGVDYAEPETDPNRTTAGVGATFADRSTNDPGQTSGNAVEVGARFSQRFEGGGTLQVEANPVGSDVRTLFEVRYEDRGDPITSAEIQDFNAGARERVREAAAHYNAYRLVSGLPEDVRSRSIPDYAQAKTSVREAFALLYARPDEALHRFIDAARQDPQAALEAIGTDRLGSPIEGAPPLPERATERVRQGAEALLQLRAGLGGEVADVVDTLQRARPNGLGLDDALDPARPQPRTSPDPQPAQPQPESGAITPAR